MIHPDLTYTADAIKSYISDLVGDLKFPMTANLQTARVDELRWWFELLRDVETLDATRLAA